MSDGSEGYEGSARQRRAKRRTRTIAIVLALALLVPIVLSSAAAMRG